MPVSRDLLACFGTYDIRGKSPEIIDENAAFLIGKAFALTMGAGRIVLGHDARETSPQLAAAAANGIRHAGSDVIALGLCGTEEVYFATNHTMAAGGICVTASHNPKEFNGFKFVSARAQPLTGADPLGSIRANLKAAVPREGSARGVLSDGSHLRAAYVEKVLSFLSGTPSKPLKILINPGKGAAGPTFDAIATALRERKVPWQFIRHNHIPDPAFPGGVPNPLLPENRQDMTRTIRRVGCDLGVAWDGDFDRCFFFDHRGAYVSGEYIVSILAAGFCGGVSEKVVYDPRVTGCIENALSKVLGTGVLSRCGHAFVKDRMLKSGAVYGGERSGHHYFRDFMGCDSGMIPMVLIASILEAQGTRLSDIVAPLRQNFPSSEEVNFTVNNPENVIRALHDRCEQSAEHIDFFDGLSMKFASWRFNLRSSRTESCLRLNVESFRNSGLIVEKVSEISSLIARNDIRARSSCLHRAQV